MQLILEVTDKELYFSPLNCFDNKRVADILVLFYILIPQQINAFLLSV